MKTVIFLGTPESVRLGVYLADHLSSKGDRVYLMGRKTILPTHTSVKKIVLAPSITAKMMASALKKMGIQKVISFMNLPVCAAADAAKIPYIYTEVEDYKERKLFSNKKNLLKNAQRVVVIGNGDKKLNTRMYSTNAVRTTNPAVWVEHYNSNSSSYTKPACFKKQNNIVAAGNFSKSGGFDVLLETWARLAPAHSTWHLTLVGDGAQKNAINRFIKKNNLENSTEVVGSKTDLYSLLSKADIYVNPARRSEGLDTVLDAMASKLPVLTTNIKGTDTLISNGINGMVVKAGEEAPLTSALDDLMVNWGKRVGMAVQAEHLKNRYPFEEFVSLFE